MIYILKYWRKHKIKLFELIAIISISAAGIVCSMLLGISSKKQVFESDLVTAGNYDEYIYDGNTELEKYLEESTLLEGLGCLYTIGYCEIDGTCYRLGAYKDKRSMDIVHLTCTSGNYPERENGIALDLSVLQEAGYVPAVGNHVDVILYDNAGKMLADTTMQLDGIFENVDSQNGIGYSRAPYNEEAFYGSHVYEPVLAVVNNDWLAKLSAEYAVDMFLQCKGEADRESLLSELYTKNIGNIAGMDSWQIDSPYGRSYAYENALGIVAMTGEMEEQGMDAVKRCLKEGIVFQDFLNGKMLPVIGAFIVMIAAFSIVGILYEVFLNRRKSLRSIHNIGIDDGKIILALLLELAAIFAVSVSIGLGLGIGLYILMMHFEKHVLGLHTFWAFHLDSYMKEVVINPYVYVVVVMGCIMLVNMIVTVALYKGLYDSAWVKLRGRRNRRKKHTDRRIYQNLQKLISDKIISRGTGLMLTISILIFSCLFSYFYFVNRVENDNSALEYSREQYGLDDYNYIATAQYPMGWYGVESQHNKGLEVSELPKLIAHKGVEKWVAAMVSHSTKLVYPDGAQENHVFKNRAVRLCQPSDEEYEKMCYEAELAALHDIGFSDDSENIYNITTVAMPDASINKMADKIVAGDIDLAHLTAGNQLIMVMTEKAYKEYKDVFPAGSRLPLCDIVLNEEEDMVDYNAAIADYQPYTRYSKMFVDDEGNHINIVGLSVGSRVDIHAEIGAVAVISQDYLSELGLDGEEIFLLTVPEAFQKWGSNVCKYNYIKVKAALTGDYERVWYEGLKSSEGLSMSTSAYIEGKELQTQRRIMALYWFIMLNLFLGGSISFYFICSFRMRSKEKTFAVIRAIGVNKDYIIRTFAKNEVIMCIYGTLTALLLIAGIQKLTDYIYNLGEENWPAWFFGMHNNRYFIERWYIAVVLVCAVMIAMLVVTNYIQGRKAFRGDIADKMSGNDF